MNAYILVGGLSSRMGEDKASIEFEGRSILTRVVEATMPVSDQVFAVQRHGGNVAAGLPTIFEGPHEERGPAFGVRAALEHAGGAALIVAVDFPLLTSEFLGHVIGQYDAATMPMLVPAWDEQPQVLCAIYGPAVLPILTNRMAEGRHDLRGLVSECGGTLLDEATLRQAFPGEPLMNVNTPEDLERARKLLAQE